ncbi:hypothetical protein BLNAU_2081 [Blattamonas nauphoetae]|uniref:Protein kinase domain-containing protein n=1 Tax=Blattamonas nauphoetae TaxID=2049346 RepID=A0ABQ9YH20_9EUKA|nr:hypothetical protein BLNAU_2081 [Blattamonas nauphoetae]
MLGCVVSLTSSHLSGSTIRDVNTGGSVLCSNSSFSSLLPSPSTNADPPFILLPAGEYTPDDFEYGKPLWFLDDAGDENTSIVFTNCHFTGANYKTRMVLRIYSYPGTISIHSCSFSDIAPAGYPTAVYIYKEYRFNHAGVAVTSSNFTNCSTDEEGGAMFIKVADDLLIQKCQFEGCSANDVSSDGGGALYLFGFSKDYIPTKFNLVDCVIADCSPARYGGGVFAFAGIDLSIVDTKFERCELTSESKFQNGGGLYTSMYFESALTVERCHFIDCSSKHGGGAIGSMSLKNLSISDTLVKDCYSGTTGAILMRGLGTYSNYSFLHVFFDGNTIGDDTSFFSSNDLRFEQPATKFTDLALFFTYSLDELTLKIDTCFTTIHPDSTGMLFRVNQLESGLYDHERILDPEFDKIGPLLTSKPTSRMNEKTGKIEMEMEGKTPLPSQEYEVTAKGEDGTDAQFKMLFSDGTGTLVSGSESNLQYHTNYTITSIVGVVPDSSSSRMTNDVTVPVAAWAFNLAVTPSFLSFTTPETPSFSTLQFASADLVDSDPQFAFVILHFDKEVSGSYEFVVLEDGEEVTLTITTEAVSKSGATKEFKVIGDGKLLTHDTTYAIKSIVPTAESEALFVWMNETIRFHIPKSSYVPPEDPEEPEDPKKSMSPEMKAMLSWLIPLVACLLLALIVLIVVFVLVYRRKKNEPDQKEMDDQDEVRVEDKMEVVEEEYTNRVIETDGLGHSSGAADDQSTRMNQSRDGLEGRGRKEWVEVMACSGGFEISAAPMTNTLYSVLHKEHREIGKRTIGIQIVNGLKQVVANRGWSDVLTRLSSHWILIDTSGNVQLKLQMNASEAEQEAARKQMLNQLQDRNENEQTVNEASERSENSEKDRSGMDGMRWRAPEVVGSKGVSVDGQKASVFSLGLILWEIETGQVPFGELDAVNAQRQSGTGIGPKMDSLKNEEFIALIRRCVSVDPELRPTLSEIGEFLSSHPNETIGGSGNEMKE